MCTVSMNLRTSARYLVVTSMAVLMTITVMQMSHHQKTKSRTPSNRQTVTDPVVPVGRAPETAVLSFSSARAAMSPSERRLWRQPNRLVTEYDDDVSRRLEALTSRKASAADPEVVQLARDLMDTPPTNSDGVKHPRYIMKTPQAAKVEELTNSLKGGFFVECGALDGERSSNSIYLEKTHAWTGLLVEMDPYFYTQLLGKNRQVWSINACLSPYNYITTLQYRGDESGRGTLMLGSNINSAPRQARVPCFPLETLLLVLNRTVVDYFSLDVEGVEMPILRTIPWKSLDVRVLSVEYGHGPNGKTPYVEYMAEQGYRVESEIVESSYVKALFVEDFIFVKNETSTGG